MIKTCFRKASFKNELLQSKNTKMTHIEHPKNKFSKQNSSKFPSNALAIPVIDSKNKNTIEIVKNTIEIGLRP